MEKKNKKTCQELVYHEGMMEDMDGFWMKPELKVKISSIMTQFFQKVSTQWNVKDSQRVVDIVEKLVFRTIDVDKILNTNMSRDGCTFSFNIVHDVCSDELLDLLLECHTDKWKYIQEVFMEDGKVALFYEDRYVNSPLGCLLLAQFIRRLRDLFKLRYNAIEIILSRKNYRVIFDDDTLKIDRKFSFPENRDAFLRLCLDEIVREPYSLVIKNTKHSRALVVRNSNYELSIRPEGGISFGWGIENGIHSALTVDTLMKKPDINIRCFNRAAHSYDKKGITYVVSLLPLRIVENLPDV